jgi:hypothetical protein
MIVLRLLRFGEVQRFARDLLHVRLAALHEHRHVELFAERFELVHRRRAIHVGGDEQRLRPCFWMSRASLPDWRWFYPRHASRPS